MFEVLEHTADVGFRAFGSTLEDLFANAALAMLSIAGEPSDAEPREQYELEAEGGDLESLLVNWLSEVLWWYDGRRIAFQGFRITHLNPAGMRATGFGEPLDPARHRTRIIVKAVTYHRLQIAPSGGGW